MKVCVVGAGAAGCMAAIMLARGGAEVVLLEKNEKIGKKIYITGKGRCNLTNNCDINDFFAHIVHGEKFLRSAIYSFTSQDTMSFFEEAGLSLVTERGNRVFPESQKSSDVIKTLEKELKRARVSVKYNCKVFEINSVDRKDSAECADGVGTDTFEVVTDEGIIDCDKVVVATGGVSYPSTGSTGDGYAFARSFGHKITPPKQGLVPIHVKQECSLQGISLKNVELSALSDSGKCIASRFGELMFTDRGLSGPIALTLSSYINRIDSVKLVLDLKPSLDEKQLDARILRDFEERKNQDIKNVTRALLPDRLNLYVLRRADIAEWKKVNVITKEERARLVHTVKNLVFDVKELAPFTEAVITSGGVDVKELKPSCESRLKSGIYFVGE
ncbi:MAG: NAD(P)/FAD-dependent oxidoreductase, partial [Clostridia bacterium]|nr:NAD(P)/FAD-dependent oxidoreductase [Clostridia bacterium]